MATLREAVKAALVGDAALMALLTGGLKDWDELGRLGLAPETAAYESDGIRLKPQAVLTWSTSSPSLTTYGPTQGERRFCQVWFYTHASYSTIEAAQKRTKVVLNRLRVSATDWGLTMLHFVDDGPDFVADELKGAFAASSRYFVERTRR